MRDHERPRAERAQRAPTERDRILSRVRTTTAVTGVGAVLVGGALAGWLGHAATSDGSTSDPAGTSTSDGSSSPGSDDGLTGPDTVPESGGNDDQPGITSGGS